MVWYETSSCQKYDHQLWSSNVDKKYFLSNAWKEVALFKAKLFIVDKFINLKTELETLYTQADKRNREGHLRSMNKSQNGRSSIIALFKKTRATLCKKTIFCTTDEYY